MIEIQNQEYWKRLFEEEIKILTPQEIEEIKNTKIKEYTSSTIRRRMYFLAREKTKTIRMEEETISMTMEEDNNQYNPIEIKDNRIYNNYVMSIESEDNDDKEFNKKKKKRLVEKKEENSKKEKRIKEIEEKVEEDMKEKEEMKNEIQIKDQTIKKLTKDIMALKKKHENEISTKNNECDKKIFKFHAESERKRSEVNNLTQQLLFLKDKLSKLENKNTKEEKKKDEQTDREEEILTLYKCFALKLFERKLRGQLKEEIIERLIHEFGIKVNDINEYKEILKKTFKIKNENKREINRIMEEEIIKHQLKDNELKEIIFKMNKKEEIEEDEVMKIFKEEEMKEQEDVQFINYYYYNKKKVHQIININKNEIIINTLDDYYHYIKSVASTINIINKNKQERSGKKSIERILQSKICRLRDLLINKEYMKLKRIINIKKYDIYHIKIKTNEQIKYYKYLRNMKIIEIESRKNNLKRIRWNYKMMKYGKMQHLNKSKEDEYPDNISSINFWKGIYETNTNIDFLNINLYEILIENRINDKMAIITPNELDCAIKFIANWKAPGVDKIQGFWIKYLEQPKKYLLKLFNELLNNPNEIPPHFIQGRTILIYKKGDKLDKQNYRPITCLNCLLKIYTSILKMKIENQLMLNPIEKQLSLNQI
ncbi:hypothetical protein ENUP19_0166G0027 [Entamoeba nuttalli]|uniref:Reverse transcriptase domain-containing protein n=1 Tax=Entamoeba nuttalli TaxID=412467 RepID=A0ABQ0DM59_9EUKA